MRKDRQRFYRNLADRLGLNTTRNKLEIFGATNISGDAYISTGDDCLAENRKRRNCVGCLDSLHDEFGRYWCVGVPLDFKADSYKYYEKFNPYLRYI